jgi:hypothetical protein
MGKDRKNQSGVAKSVLDAMLDNHGQQLANLAGRWQDESEYEDFAEYEDVMKTMVPEGCEFFYGITEPFGFIMKGKDLTYQVDIKEKADGATVGWKPIKKLPPKPEFEPKEFDHHLDTSALTADEERQQYEDAPTYGIGHAAPREIETPAPAKTAKPTPTLDEALATARKENPNRYAHVVAVTELTKDGDPKRVIIECSDPQTKQVGGQDVSVCEKTREIAVQDLFQVYRCAACADRAVRKARRNRAKAKTKALKQQIRLAKGN